MELPNHLKPKILKVLVIKVFLDVSQRVAENLALVFLDIRIDHFITHYWEKRLSDYIIEVVNLILKKLWNFDYGKTFIDSTKFSNKAGEQIKIHAIELEKHDLKFPQGGGYFYGDGEYDDKEYIE